MPKEATCQEVGSGKRICSKCGYEETSTHKGPHTYKNGKCAICGEKEPAEKSYIEANTWYTYNPLPQLKIQNCIVCTAIPTGGGNRIAVNYSPACLHCHAVGLTSSISVSYEKNDFYYCPECGGATTVVFRIAY